MENKDFSLHDYLHTIGKRKAVIIECVVLVVFFVMLLAYFQIPVYEAKGKILIEKDDFSIEDNRRVFRYEEPLINYIEMMKSEIVQKKIVLTLKSFFERMNNDINASDFKLIYLKYFPKNYEYLMEIYSTNENMDNFFVKEKDKILKNLNPEFLENLENYDFNVFFNPGTAVIESDVRFRNHVIAEYILNTIFEIISEMLQGKSNEEHDKKIIFIEQQIDKVTEDINRFESEINLLKKPNNIHSISRAYEVLETEITDLKLEREKAYIELGKAKISFEEIKKKLDNKDYPQNYSKKSELVYDTFLGRLKFEYLNLQGQLKNLEGTYGKEHPKVIELNKTKALLENEIDKELGSKDNYDNLNNPFYNNLLEQYVEDSINITKLTAQILTIDKLLEKKEEEYSKFPDLNREYSMLVRELNIAEKTYDLLLENYNSINIKRAAIKSKVVILDSPKGSLKKLKPDYRFNFLLSLIAGLLTGITIAFLVEHLDRTIKSSEEAVKLFEMPLFARIPQYEESKITDTEGKTIDSMLVTYYEPKNLVTEQYKMLMINSKFGFKGINDKKSVIMVNSAEAGEGKSMVSANLAITYAMAGYKTIIVDTDFHKPDQHRLFGLDNFHGLTDILLGEKKEDLIRATSIERLHLLPSGAVPPSPAMFFETYNFSNLLDSLKKEYDIVIVDSAPSSYISDSLLLVPKVDNILFVVSLRHTDRAIIQKTITDIKNIFNGPMGLICNKVSLKNIAGHYYRY